MITGRVKWFSNKKGYGFLVADDGNGEDIFVHYSEVKGDGFKTLKEGEAVTFEITPGPKGNHAQNVNRV